MAAKGRKRGKEGVTIVLRREEVVEAGHHGGAWKVAYADFVTAMMAFFLLMWLLNATTEEQRRGLADYFAPSNISARASASGSGLPFGGRTVNADGDRVSDDGAVRLEQGPAPVLLDPDEDEAVSPEPAPRLARLRPATPMPQSSPEAHQGAAGTAEDAPEDAPGEPPLLRVTLPPLTLSERAVAAEVQAEAERIRQAEAEAREAERLAEAAELLRAAVREDPALAELAQQLVVEQVPEGLRIQILDAERQPMFAAGVAAPNERARVLLQRVVAALARLPNAIAVAGHTDATPFRGGERSNWELSAERANAVRRLLVEGGVAEARLASVSGHADRQPILPDQPAAAANRRVAITVLRSEGARP